MADKPFFSIAIPTYNRSDKLKRALKQLLIQEFPNFEIVVSDNCSTDKTREVVSSFKSPKIKYYRNKKNIDVLPNVRKVIKLCSGQYIFLHGDDDFLINKSTLAEIYKVIKKTKAGYVRCNYLSLSPDEKHIFDFRASKSYIKDTLLKPKGPPAKVIDFLIKSDCSFLTGIIFKNGLPPDASVIDSHLYSWFPIIYYSAEKFGAYYFNKPYIIAGWSQWRARNDNFNSLYSLRNGELTSENYFNFVKTMLDKEDYKKFLHRSLMGVYVRVFPAIKFFTGNKNMLQLASRLRYLSPDLKYEVFYWTYFFIAFISPRTFLGFIRKYYLIEYIKRLSLDNKYNIEKILENNV